jgi:molybdopterin-guanine dinucleotide biosynthesis protein A
MSTETIHDIRGARAVLGWLHHDLDAVDTVLCEPGDCPFCLRELVDALAYQTASAIVAACDGDRDEAIASVMA